MPSKSTFVSMGKSLAVLLGTPKMLSSGPLTYCSAALFQAKKNGEILANLMTHRGVETSETYKKNLREEIKAKNLNDKGIEWDVVTVQTANSTRNPKTGSDLVEGGVGQHECTTEALIHDVHDVLGIEMSTLRSKVERGPKVDFDTNICEAAIESNGKAEVPQRSGGCVIM